MQLAANLTFWKQAPCPRGLISGATPQVGMEKATSSFCSSLIRQWGPSNEGCTAAADGWKTCLSCLLNFFSFPSEAYLASFMPGTSKPLYNKMQKWYNSQHHTRAENSKWSKPLIATQPLILLQLKTKHHCSARAALGTISALQRVAFKFLVCSWLIHQHC